MGQETSSNIISSLNLLIAAATAFLAGGPGKSEVPEGNEDETVLVKCPQLGEEGGD